MVRSSLALVAWLISSAWASGGPSGCSPIVLDDGSNDDDPTLDAGRLEDEEISLDWRLYGAWEGGACLDLRFTNLGDRVATWAFDVQMDGVIEGLPYSGPAPAALSVVLDEARITPFGPPAIEPFGFVSYPICTEPIVRPIGFDATVTRDGDGEGDTDEALLFGSVQDDTGAVVLIWKEQATTTGDTCLSLRLGNLTEDDLVDWSARILFSGDFDLTDVDSSFYYFDADLAELDVSPTNSTVRFRPLAIQGGTVCLDRRVEPVSFTIAYTRQPPSPNAAAPAPDPVWSVDPPGGGAGDLQVGRPW